jgi:hypothetical protein
MWGVVVAFGLHVSDDCTRPVDPVAVPTILTEKERGQLVVCGNGTA